MKYLKFFLIILPFLLTGCTYKELNTLGIAESIAITKENDNYIVYVEVIDTNNVKENDSIKKETYISEGFTIGEALRKTITKTSKRLYIKHLSVLIIDEKLALEGISDIMDFFFRNSESRGEFYTLVSKVDIDELYKDNTINIYDMIKTNKNYLNNVLDITFIDVLSKYVNPNIDIALPALDIEDGVILKDTAIFRDDKLVGYITNEDTLFLKMILNDVTDTIIKNSNSTITIELNKCDTSISVTDTIDININLEGSIKEINESINLSNPDNIRMIEQDFENDLNKRITDMIDNVLTNYNSDIFGFKDILYKNKKDINISYNINSNIKLTYKGNGVNKLNER